MGGPRCHSNSRSIAGSRRSTTRSFKSQTQEVYSLWWPYNVIRRIGGNRNICYPTRRVLRSRWDYQSCWPDQTLTQKHVSCPFTKKRSKWGWLAFGQFWKRYVSKSPEGQKFRRPANSRSVTPRVRNGPAMMMIAYPGWLDQTVSCL